MPREETKGRESAEKLEDDESETTVYYSEKWSDGEVTSSDDEL